MPRTEFTRIPWSGFILVPCLDINIQRRPWHNSASSRSVGSDERLMTPRTEPAYRSHKLAETPSRSPITRSMTLPTLDSYGAPHEYGAKGDRVTITPRSFGRRLTPETIGAEGESTYSIATLNVSGFARLGANRGRSCLPPATAQGKRRDHFQVDN
jgi:hypothetical protein